MFLVAAVGCTARVEQQGDAGPAKPMRASVSSAASVMTSTGQVCSPTGAHGAHEITACTTCHACGGTYGFSVVTLSGGTTTDGGQLTRGNPTTCSVGCHNVSGVTPAPVIAWNATGPLACTSCHVQPSGSLTRHAIPQADPLADRAGCQACHVLDQHLSGTVRIDTGSGVIDANRNDPAALSAVCQNCHNGVGKDIDGYAPPLLVGWTDSVSGDFHGARAGVGTSLLATLKPPFYRGQPPLACVYCHQPHSSPNAYLFAAAAPIDRAGVGAEQLCMNCHDGDRHGWCASCHGLDPMPSGAPCLYCHGHEGITAGFVWPQYYAHDGSPAPDDLCAHCHSNWAPPPLEYIPPTIVNSFVQVQFPAPGTAAVMWTTNEPATSFVEWGTGTLDHVTGDRNLVTSHSVTLTALAPATTYQLRARTADAYRNLTRSQLVTFDTPDPTAPPAPVTVHMPNTTVCGSPARLTFQWSPVTAPTGNPVQYRLVISPSALFDTLYLDSGWTTATQYTVSFPVTTMYSYYYWRVQASDVTLGKVSPWSATDQFWVNRYRTGFCP
jgi:predicted CXXCH cytochrome family protein